MSDPTQPVPQPDTPANDPETTPDAQPQPLDPGQPDAPEQQPVSPEPQQPSPGVQPSQTDDLLEQILQMQRDQRSEVSGLRDEISRQRTRSDPPRPTVALSEEDVAAARREEIGQHEFYCPGCGRLSTRWRECVGRGEAPHPPIDMVETSELEGDDTSQHTEAPGVLP